MDVHTQPSVGTECRTMMRGAPASGKEISLSSVIVILRLPKKSKNTESQSVKSSPEKKNIESSHESAHLNPAQEISNTVLSKERVSGLLSLASTDTKETSFALPLLLPNSTFTKPALSAISSATSHPLVTTAITTTLTDILGQSTTMRLSLARLSSDKIHNPSL